MARLHVFLSIIIDDCLLDFFLFMNADIWLQSVLVCPTAVLAISPFLADWRRLPGIYGQVYSPATTVRYINIA